MSNVGYDLDTSGGLMPLIRALIKPPDEEANGQKSKKQQHPYYKRPGKGHNRDSCDACGEGGDLICCDRCPASFHLGCYDPPLDEHCIPAGLWLCKQCSAEDGAAATTSSSSTTSRAHSTENKQEDKKRTLCKKPSKEESDSDSKKSDEGKEREDKKPTPMDLLASAARVMNPTQFELPREMRVPCPFPGTEKEGSNGAPSIVTVDSQGLVPLPAKTCYVCEGTCKMAPLLQCDYCPLLFHQDCLDPPLTALPTGRWMCPNHVEQYIDWKMVNSISATERVALWDRFSGPVDQHAIKVDFIRRARNRRPCFRVKVPMGVRGRVMVPRAVKAMYDSPPSLLPSRREAVRCYNVLKTLKSQNLYPEEEDRNTKQSVCLNNDCPQYKGEGPCPRGEGHPHDGEDLKAIKGEKEETQSDSETDSDVDYTSAPKRRKLGGAQSPKAGVTLRGDAARLLPVLDQQLDKLDRRLVKVLAWQRLQQILVGEQCGGLWRRAPLSPAAEQIITASVDRTKLAKHGFRHVALPSELLTPTERRRISKSVFGGIENPLPLPRESLGHTYSDVALRATLSPVIRSDGALGDSIGRPIAMRLSRLTIGSHSGCDVVLDGGPCRRVSSTHALLFLDEVTRHFELINYSEWGSMVNGVMYACDLSRAPAPLAGGPSPLGPLRLPQPLMPSTPDHALCRCPMSKAEEAWEGSALVPHGALLQFGCHMFVFSVVDPPKEEDPAL